MKKIHLIYAACLLVGMGACAASVQKQVKDNSDVWKEYNTGAVLFEDKAPETLGSDIYHRIIPDAESYIKEQARTVLATLYNSPEDSIPAVHKIHYTLEDINGISAKGGGNGDVTIFYSTRHIEKSFAANDTAKLFFETRGVLLHELTHAYQLEPQGIGSYGTNRVFWAFIEEFREWEHLVTCRNLILEKKNLYLTWTTYNKWLWKYFQKNLKKAKIFYISIVVIPVAAVLNACGMIVKVHG